MDICGKCMGTGVAGHPDSGYTCDCNGGMTDPTPTRAEMERFDLVNVAYDLGEYVKRIEQQEGGRFVRWSDYANLRERAEAAEAERDEARAAYLAHKRLRIDAEQQAHAARLAEAAAWNDAIEAAGSVADQYADEWPGSAIAGDIRALRRAAPTEDR